ncbi:hypothetical protein GCM10009615_03410 [Corynebacterium durum]
MDLLLLSDQTKRALHQSLQALRRVLRQSLVGMEMRTMLQLPRLQPLLHQLRLLLSLTPLACFPVQQSWVALHCWAAP